MTLRQCDVKNILTLFLKVDFAENQPSSTPLCSKCTTLRSGLYYAYQVYLRPQEGGRSALERVVDYPGTDNTDPYATMSDEFSGRPREGDGQRIPSSSATSTPLCISVQASRTGQEESVHCL